MLKLLTKSTIFLQFDPLYSFAKDSHDSILFILFTNWYRDEAICDKAYNILLNHPILLFLNY